MIRNRFLSFSVLALSVLIALSICGCSASTPSQPSSSESSPSMTPTQKPPTESAIATKYVTASPINLRSGPGESYGVLSKFEQGTKVEVLAFQGDWTKVRVGERVGYMWSEFLGEYSPTPESPKPTSDADLYYFAKITDVDPLSEYGYEDWGDGTHYTISVWKGVSVKISDRRTNDDGHEQVRIVRQDGGQEGWTSPDFLSSTPPLYSCIDIGIPTDISGLSFFSDDIFNNPRSATDYIRVYRFDGVSPQTGIENAIAALGNVGWQIDKPIASSMDARWQIRNDVVISPQGDLLADLQISGSDSIELANHLSSGKPLGRMVHIQWTIEDPSYLIFYYSQDNIVQQAQIAQVQELYTIAEDPSLSFEQKQERAKVCQRNWGEEVFATIVRLLPIYNTETKQFESFDSAMRDLAGSSGSDSGTPMDEDPVGAAIRIIIDPSWETITEMFGLP